MVWVCSIGASTLEAKKAFKIDANVFEGFLGRNFILNKNFSLISGLEVMRVKGNYTSVIGQHQYLLNEYLNIPISISYSKKSSEKISLFGGFGFYSSFLLKSKNEDFFNESVSVSKNLGATFGIQSNLGLKFIINKSSYVNLAFKAKTDVYDSFKNNVQEYVITDFYSLQLGFGFIL
ncbi:hypothetical protein [Polaribacter sp.]|uniref:hypothetical protein n=1 Tax=Polaribacter sp. TaxID=1920175 RepID=UPI003F69C22B